MHDAHGSRPVRVVSRRGHGGKPAAQACDARAGVVAQLIIAPDRLVGDHTCRACAPPWVHDRRKALANKGTTARFANFISERSCSPNQYSKRSGARRSRRCRSHGLAMARALTQLATDCFQFSVLRTTMAHLKPASFWWRTQVPWNPPFKNFRGVCLLGGW